jgi:peptidoglycan hydrolase-like protein with peptidoglycan-binding domain
MSLASKIWWAGIVVALLTTGMLVEGFPRNPAGPDSNPEGVSTFVIKNEISKMQETLLIKGHYRGKVDGVFGLRTRASIRAYQKAESLPVTGQVDARTADRLGIRPESNWDNSKSTGQEMGHGSDKAVGEINRDKPSAGIRRAERRTNKTLRKTVSRSESDRGDREKTLQAENDTPQ